MRQHKVFLRHELLKYNSEKSTAKSSALENYISSANLSLSGCSSAEPNSVSVGRCKFQLKKLYLQTVKKVDHLPINLNNLKSDIVSANFNYLGIVNQRHLYSNNVFLIAINDKPDGTFNTITIFNDFAKKLK